jgi:hypothetical protein
LTGSDDADELILLRAENHRLRGVVGALRELCTAYRLGSRRMAGRALDKLDKLEGKLPTKVRGEGD